MTDRLWNAVNKDEELGFQYERPLELLGITTYHLG